MKNKKEQEIEVVEMKTKTAQQADGVALAMVTEKTAVRRECVCVGGGEGGVGGRGDRGGWGGGGGGVGGE